MKDVKEGGTISQDGTVTNDAPAQKFQNEQEVEGSTGFETKTGKSGYTLEKKKAPGSQLKQAVAASVVKDSNLVGGNSGDGASFAGTRSSGSVGGIVGAANATPNVGKPNRSEGRTGKKLDRNSTKLNYIPSDQVLTEWDESKPLSEAKDLDQGYDGTYRNEFARSQKIAENVPGALMFERSLDLLVKDKIYFGQGQIIKQTGVTDDIALDAIPVQDANGIYHNYTSGKNYDAGSFGNYLPKQLIFKHDSRGNLQYIIFREEDLTVTGVSEHVANKSSTALKVAMNRAELWREVMDSKAGDEKGDIWTCLARATYEPTATVGFLEAIEADTGNETITALLKSELCFSFQMNRAHKDGQDDVFPGVLALMGIDTNYVSSDYAKIALPSNMGDVFTTLNYQQGCAGTMIGLYDSVNKYKTKADILLQPRGPRMHIQTALNNIDPLYADKDYVAMLAANEVYSTIDREYDPNGVVCLTDKANIIHRISWNKMGSFIKAVFDGEVDYKSAADASDHTLLPAEVLAFAKETGKNMYFVYAKETVGSISYSTGKFVATSNFEFANSEEFKVCFLDATPDYDTETEACITVANADIVTTNGLIFNFKGDMTDFVANANAPKNFYYQGGPARYMYNDLRNNYVITVNHPLLQGITDYLEQGIGAAYAKLAKGEVRIPIVHSTMYFSLWSLIVCAATPYITKARVNAFRDILYYEKNVEYPFKDALIPVKDLKRFNFKNIGFNDIDTELEVKTMMPVVALGWIFPELVQQVGYDSEHSEIKVLMPWYACQNEVNESGVKDDVSAMCFPSIRSGVRFAALDNLYAMSERDVRLSLDKVSAWLFEDISYARSLAYKYSSVTDGQLVLAIPNTGITGVQWMKLPRELGFVMDAPYGILTPDYDGNRRYGTNIIGTNGIRAYYWTGANPVTHTCGGGSQSILVNKTININRAANFKQSWYAILANGAMLPADHGFVLSLGQLISNAGALHYGDSYFKPYQSVDGATNVTSGVNGMISLQKALWTRIQKLPFIISPFDLKVIDNTDSPNNALIPDLFDFMYIFGLGGFRASDFRESVYNREKEIVNQGYLFVRDPWVIESPLFKEGATASNVKVSKGFEV